MAISTREYDNQGNASSRVALDTCPCGYEFGENEMRWIHIWMHKPEDFGLSPLGERAAESIEDSDQ